MLKKLLFFVFLTLLLSVAFSYVFIPSELDISSIVYSRCNDKSASRFLSAPASWGQCKKDFQGEISQALPDFLNVPWQFENQPLPTTLLLVPGAQDTLALQWKCRVATGINPYTRIRRYQAALALKKEMKAVLTCLGTKLLQDQNLYTVPVHQIISPDSDLVAIRVTLGHLPLTEDTYRLVGRLQTYLSEQQALQTDYPMQHIADLGNGKFELMVALPTNRSLPGKGDIFYRRFVPWHTVVAIITGGPAAMAAGTQQLQLYLEDHHRVSMAMSFESLVTNRSTEKDTSRWITNVCQPVF